MENLEEFNLVEMKKAELQEVEGGFLFAFTVGLMVGWLIGDLIW